MVRLVEIWQIEIEEIFDDFIPAVAHGIVEPGP
jgi:hypothetical protein